MTAVITEARSTTSVGAAVVVPILNEEDNVSYLVQGLRDDSRAVNQPGLHDAAVEYGRRIVVILVDDSTHDMGAVAAKKAQELLDTRCGGTCTHLTITHVHRTGDARTGRLAGAVLHGAKLAIRRYNAPRIAVMDGDLQHNPAYIPELLEGLDEVDLVATTRYHKNGSAAGLSNFYRRLVSRSATYLVKTLFARSLRKISDPMTGFYSFRSDTVSLDELNVVGFKVLFATLNANPKLSRKSIPFTFGSRLHGESKGDLKEGLSFLKQVLMYRLKGDFLNFMVGGAGIGAAGIYLLQQLVERGIDRQFAYTVMLVTTLAANFLWNRFFTWRGQSKGNMAQQARKFLVTRAMTLCGSWLAFGVLVSRFGMDYQMVNIGCMLISTGINYITSKRIFGAAPANA